MNMLCMMNLFILHQADEDADMDQDRMRMMMTQPWMNPALMWPKVCNLAVCGPSLIKS